MGRKLLEKENQIRCIVCDKLQLEGIVVLDEFICDQCEREMVQTHVEDEKYPYFVFRMRKIWLKEQA